MYEKVNPKHPDKIADRIAGAIVDLAYKKMNDPKIAVEVLIGHNKCNIIIESNIYFNHEEINKIVKKITESNDVELFLINVEQDVHLAKNQNIEISCGDNGIFKGVKTNNEEQVLTNIANYLYNKFNADGKYLINQEDKKIVICQANASLTDFKDIKNTLLSLGYEVIINPLGEWTGGINVDSGATNRKLGSDMGRAVTGGGLHGKDLSKADVTLNICAYLNALDGEDFNMMCSIGDKNINGIEYKNYVEQARNYIKSIGGFEKLAEWGLIRPTNI